MKVVGSRQGKNDVIGEEGKVLPKDTDKFAYGDKVQVELTGNHVTGKLFDFSPASDQYLKEHLFADIFARGSYLNPLTNDVVNIPAGVKHWHGAAKDSWFSHIAIAVPAEGATTEWLEEVSDEEYSKLK